MCNRLIVTTVRLASGVPVVLFMAASRANLGTLVRAGVFLLAAQVLARLASGLAVTLASAATARQAVSVLVVLRP
jgi:hypothetical protein